MIKKQRILVVAAHPDDEVLGCGGTIAKHTAVGDIVWFLILGQGVTSRKNISDKEKISLLLNLKANAKKAVQILGADNLIFEEFPDNKFDTVAMLDLVQTIEKVVAKFKPNVVYTHCSSDVNVDHRLTIDAVQSALRPGLNNTVQKLLSFEIPSSTEWNFVRKPFKPNIFIQISKQQLDKKIKALFTYKDEVRPFPHPRSQEYVSSLAKVRGGQGGFQLAEAFKLIYKREN